MGKSYHVYGVGSALIDFQYKIECDEEWPVEITPGTSLLINDAIEASLLKKLDQITPLKNCGGTTANTLNVLSQLGSRVFYSCGVGADAEGEYFHDYLRTAHIESNLDTREKLSAKTGKCMVIVHPNADRGLCTFGGAMSLITPAELNLEVLANSRYFLTEIFLAAFPTSKVTMQIAMRMAKSVGCQIVLNISTCILPGFDKKEIRSIMASGVDLLFCNEEEAMHVLEVDTLSAAKEKLKSFAKQFVITRGADDTIVYDGTQFFAVPTYAVTPVDTTGAGDVFAGAFLRALSQEMTLPEAAKFANLAAAKVITKYGPQLDANAVNELKEMICHLPG